MKIDKYYFWKRQSEKRIMLRGATYNDLYPNEHQTNSKRDHYCQFIMEGKLWTSIVTGTQYHYLEIQELKDNKFVTGYKRMKEYNVVGLEGAIDARDIIILGRSVDLLTRVKAENFRLQSKLRRVKDAVVTLEGYNKKYAKGFVETMRSTFNAIKDDPRFGLISTNAREREMAKLLVEHEDSKEKQNDETTK
jgi:hypothetical protein